MHHRIGFYNASHEYNNPSYIVYDRKTGEALIIGVTSKAKARQLTRDKNRRIKNHKFFRVRHHFKPQLPIAKRIFSFGSIFKFWADRTLLNRQERAEKIKLLEAGKHIRKNYYA